MNREILYDVSWQLMRVSFLGNWNDDSGVTMNLAALDRYIFTDTPIVQQPNWTDEMELCARRYRGLNLCNAVRMGYSGQGLATSDWTEQVRIMRNQIRDLPDTHRWLPWSWERVRDQLRVLARNDPQAAERILTNLEGRKRMAIRNTGTTEKRPELVMFMSMLRRELSESRNKAEHLGR